MSLARVYRISSPSTPFFYIGSTTKSLKRRLWQHKKSFKNTKKRYLLTSWKIIQFKDCIITLIEESPMEILEIIEYQIIDELSKDGTLFNLCVNKKKNIKILQLFYPG